MQPGLVVVLAGVAGVLLASLIEYVVHRLMHAGVLRGTRHAEHHRDGWGQGFWPEFRDYLLPGGLLVVAPAWFLDRWLATGWTLGCVGYSAFAAYAHQLQHEQPMACRWMAMPVHYVHHRDQMWRHNFGLAVDWWDHVFGTYLPVPFGEEFPARGAAHRPLRIHWRATSGEDQPLAGPGGAARAARAALSAPGSPGA